MQATLRTVCAAVCPRLLQKHTRCNGSGAGGSKAWDNTLQPPKVHIDVKLYKLFFVPLSVPTTRTVISGVAQAIYVATPVLCQCSSLADQPHLVICWPLPVVCCIAFSLSRRKQGSCLQPHSALLLWSAWAKHAPQTRTLGAVLVQALRHQSALPLGRRLHCTSSTRTF